MHDVYVHNRDGGDMQYHFPFPTYRQELVDLGSTVVYKKIYYDIYISLSCTYKVVEMTTLLEFLFCVEALS